MNKLPIVQYQELTDVSYQEAWDMQTVIHRSLVKNKMEWRSLSDEERAAKRQVNHLIFCEHNPVYTLGKSGSMDHLLLSEEEASIKSIEFFKINRGGDITYHGPGQLTGYPILDLDEFFTDVHKYVRYLEECIMRLLALYDIESMRIDGHTGVWLPPTDKEHKYRKICAIGVHLSRWVTMHGFAFNINTDLNYFKNIIPCGIEEPDKTVTSLAYELGKKLDFDTIKEQLKEIFALQFEFDYITNR